MSRRGFLLFLFLSCLAAVASSDDLFKVYITSQSEADQLNEHQFQQVAKIRGGYLVLADTDASTWLQESGIRHEFIAANLDIDILALDNSRDERNLKRNRLIFEEDGLRLVQLPKTRALALDDKSALTPIRGSDAALLYVPPLEYAGMGAMPLDDLQDLADQVSADSAMSYVYTLQAFNGRVAGTSSNYAARDWIKSKLESFGYTYVYLDYFSTYLYTFEEYRNCYNVVAIKQGYRFPERQIVIGAHFDAVPLSPGADDNGSGTAGVLEIARVMADEPTEMTYVFVLFDAEENGLDGSWYYSTNAYYGGDTIACMLNMDMIGYYENSSNAALYYGDRSAFAQLWVDLANPLTGLIGVLSGTSSRSDHYYFTTYGYDALYAAEYLFSSVYHTYRDSTSFLDFNYMAKIIKSQLATAYVINEAPLPVEITSVLDVGNGEAIQVSWEADDPGYIDHYQVFYNTEPPSVLNSVTVPPTSSAVVLSGLTTGQEYKVYIVATDIDGQQSIAYTAKYGTPYLYPRLPEGLGAVPRYKAIALSWKRNNTELDFDHYAIIRDGSMLPVITTDTFYVDYSPLLGSDFHEYLVVAIDRDGLMSDTVGATSVSNRAATLEQGRILAVNRSSVLGSAIVEPDSTMTYLEQALDGYNYDYFENRWAKAGGGPDTLDLVDMIDYGMLIIGAESGRSDDIGGPPSLGGLLDTLSMYMDLGGKAIVFGRWGDMNVQDSGRIDYAMYQHTADSIYNTVFSIATRGVVFSFLSISSYTLYSDMIGAQSLATGYPNLTWDSLRTEAHEISYPDFTGIPCPSFVTLQASPDIQTLYSYQSRWNDIRTMNKTVAWKGSDDYVFFDIPLSFIERSAAITALQKAIADLGTSNLFIEMDYYDIEFATADTATFLPDPVTLNISSPAGDGTLAWQLIEAAPWLDVDKTSGTNPEQIVFSLRDSSYSGGVWSTDVEIRDNNAVNSPIYVHVSLAVESNGCCNTPGDINQNGGYDISDAVYVINHIFKGGPAPTCAEAADVNDDCQYNITDAVHIVNHVFKGGPPPTCSTCYQ